MRLPVLIVTAGLLLTAWTAVGQSVDAANNRIAMTVLNGPWRFHTGDDASWAEPGFHDSDWSLLRTDRGWTQQGYANYGGSGWYRLEITLPPHPGPLALYVDSQYVSSQIFANGRLIGEHGGFPPDERWFTTGRQIVPIPDDIAESGHVLLGMRVWEPPQYARALPGGIYTPPRLGAPEALEEWRTLVDRQVYWEKSASVIELIANLIGGLASLGMFVLRRKEREYMWFGIYLLVWTAYHSLLLSWVFLPVPVYFALLGRSQIVALGNLLSLEFFSILLRQRRGWPYFVGALSVVATSSAYVWDTFRPTHAVELMITWCLVIFSVCLAAIVYLAWRRGSRDAAILLIPQAWVLTETFVQRLAEIPYFARQAWAQTFRHFIAYGFNWPFPYFIPSLRGDVTNLVVLFILILRYARSRRDEERMQSELEAARTVQKVLIPSEIPVIPGFHVEAVYKPASQVGGDFFQVISVTNGSALVAVGDVSGKGMPAAMTVSLLVGTFRTLAHYTREPAEILRAMNQRMLARSAGGFTTCLVLRVDPDGNVTAANAGHLAPYLNGSETAIETGLPLGLDARSAYSASHFRLKPREQLTLITDGVPEARNAQGELFGFEQTAAIAGRSAEDIAATAQRFGQNDDVTVVKLTWEPALLSPSASLIFSDVPIVP